MNLIRITNNQIAIYGKEYEIIYKDANGYRIKVMGTIIYIDSKDCEVIEYGKKEKKNKN